MQGIVKFFNTEKGYGFVTPEDGGKDVFLHASALRSAGLQSVAEGQRIEFEAVRSNNGKGDQAENIRLI